MNIVQGILRAALFEELESTRTNSSGVHTEYRLRQMRNRRFTWGKGRDDEKVGGTEIPYAEEQYVFFDETFESAHAEEDVRDYNRRLDESFEQKRLQLEQIRQNYHHEPQSTLQVIRFKSAFGGVIRRQLQNGYFLCKETEEPVVPSELQTEWENKLRKAMNEDYAKVPSPDVEPGEVIELVRETTEGGRHSLRDRGEYTIFHQLVREAQDDETLNAVARRQRLARLKRHVKTDDRYWEEAIQRTFDKPWFKTVEKQQDGLYALVRLARQPGRVIFLMSLGELSTISENQIFLENAESVLESAFERASARIEGDPGSALEALRAADLRMLTFSGKENLKAA
jgi:hypothetical protein